MATTVSASVYDMLNDLRRELLGLLPLPTAAAAYYALLLSDNMYRLLLAAGNVPAMQRLPFSLLGVAVIASSLFAQLAKGRRPRLAALVYVAGLAGAGSALIWVSFAPLTIALFPTVILLSTALLGPQLMAAVAVLGVAATLASGWSHGQPGSALAAPLCVLAVSAVVAWLSHRNLTSAVEWAWNSYQQARACTEDARQHRAELARTLKALDEAYYRLERFSGQLAQAREAAEEARRAKQQFVATVSHELRTPLNIIIGFAELITLSPESYGVRGVPRPFMGDLNRIYRSAQHLKSLIDDVLDLSQIDARQMPLLAEPASLPAVIAEASDMIWSLATKKGLRLALEVPDTLPPLPMDRLRIRQVLLNLLSNAVRFTDAGQITVAARADGAQVEVMVADTGAGIAPEDMDRVFEEFGQLEPALNRRHGGTGLGLALSRRFVELHGGRMWAESELGKGSCFHFSLPLAPSSREATMYRPAAWPLPAGPRAQGMQALLVVGDEPMVTGLLRRHLQGYQVVPVSEGELPAAVGSYLPHAVIRNGPAASSSVAPMEQAPAEGRNGSPVRVITCPLPDPGYLGRRLGVDRYLIKPVTREQLLNLLAAYGPSVRRILIVDDDAQLAELMARSVRAAPGAYEVEVACGGQEGWTRIREWRPDLVLLDLIMEGLDGIGILQLMRADEHLRQVAVVVITAQDLPQEDARLPGRSCLQVEGLESLTVSEMLGCLQAILDALPPTRPASSPPPRPAADRPAPPAS